MSSVTTTPATTITPAAATASVVATPSNLQSLLVSALTATEAYAKEQLAGGFKYAILFRVLRYGVDQLVIAAEQDLTSTGAQKKAAVLTAADSIVDMAFSAAPGGVSLFDLPAKAFVNHFLPGIIDGMIEGAIATFQTLNLSLAASFQTPAPTTATIAP